MALVLPAISSLTHERQIQAVTLDNGANLVEGDVVCWKVQTTPAFTEVLEPAADNVYLPAGVVMAQGLTDTLNGWVWSFGQVSAKVLGSAGLTAGKALELVAGQTYLRVMSTQPEEGMRPAFVLMETYETTEVALKSVFVNVAHVHPWIPTVRRGQT